MNKKGPHTTLSKTQLHVPHTDTTPVNCSLSKEELLAQSLSKKPNAMTKEERKLELNSSFERSYNSVPEHKAAQSLWVNSEDEQGWTPLHVAAMKDNMEAAVCLVDNRALLFARSGDLRVRLESYA